ncbi:hypothetical protein [Gemmatimonas sp. UBA7669]|uniref:hypothetical protein n=1 Tax=Gemmatimonas sp. UBA7669 TaxID=1946568 RepID=UPI0025B9F850|nr:hypothetical protein [Gemmatimonas sp. UBA7669]
MSDHTRLVVTVVGFFLAYAVLRGVVNQPSRVKRLAHAFGFFAVLLATFIPAPQPLMWQRWAAAACAVLAAGCWIASRFVAQGRPTTQSIASE